MVKTFTFNVTQEDIDVALKDKSFRTCPVQIAIEREFGDQVDVGLFELGVNYNPFWQRFEPHYLNYYPHPLEVKAFLKNFPFYEEAKPFSFTMDLETFNPSIYYIPQ